MGMEYNQDGDLVEVDVNHPDHPSFIRRYIDRSEATHITIGEEEILYIYCPAPEGDVVRNNKKRQDKFAREIKKVFSKTFPDTPIVLGFYDLKFNTIEDKAAFKGVLDGSLY